MSPSNHEGADRRGSVPAFRHYRWLIFGILGAGYLLVYFHRLCPAVLAVNMMRDLQADGAVLGLLGSAYFYPYALMQLPAGLLADSWGARRTIPLFLVIAALGCLILSQAPSTGVAVIGRVVVGFGVSMLFVPAMKVLSEWFRPEEFAYVTGAFLALGGLGALCSTIPLALLNGQIGWRSSFFVIALLTLLLAMAILLVVRNSPADLKSAPGSLSRRRKGGRKSVNPILVLRSPALWPVALWFFFLPTIYLTFAGLWGGPFLEQVYGLTGLQVGTVLSLTVFGKIFASFFLVWLSDSLFKGRRPVLLLSSLAVIGLTAVLTFAPSRLTLSGLYLLCFCLGIFASGSAAIGLTAAKELFPKRRTGTALGMVTLFPFIGAAILQPLLGWILDLRGIHNPAFRLSAYQSAFSVLLVCALLSLIAAFFIVETHPEKSPGLRHNRLAGR